MSTVTVVKKKENMLNVYVCRDYQNNMSLTDISKKYNLGIGHVQDILSDFKAGVIKLDDNVTSSTESSNTENNDHDIVSIESILEKIKDHRTNTKRMRLPEDIRFDIARLMEENHEISSKDLAAALDVSCATISRIGQEFNVSRSINKEEKSSKHETKNETKEKEEKNDEAISDKKELLKDAVELPKKNLLPKSEEVKNDNADIIEINSTFNSTKVKCGLIADRHDMPVSKFIFKGPLVNHNIMDFEFQYKKCCEFIENNIPFNEEGLPTKFLEVYVTGLQSVLGALCRAAYKKKVNLNLKHYNASRSDYNTQVIFDDFPNDITTSVFEKLKTNESSVFMYKCTEKEVDISNFFAVRKFYYRDSYKPGEDVKSAIMYRDIYIVKDFETLWEIYSKLITEIMDKSKSSSKYSVFANYATISQEYNDVKVMYGNIISKGYNFKTS